MTSIANLIDWGFALSAVPAAVASVPQDTVPEPVSTVEAISPTKNTVQRSHIRYSPKELAQKAKDDKNVRVLFEEIQKVFGRTINATDSAALVDIYEYYGYDVPTILILAEYCSGLGKTRLRELDLRHLKDTGTVADRIVGVCVGKL